MVSCKRLLMTNGWIEGEFVAGNGPVASVKLFRNITKTIFGNFATQFKITSSGIKLGFVSSWFLRFYDFFKTFFRQKVT